MPPGRNVMPPSCRRQRPLRSPQFRSRQHRQQAVPADPWWSNSSLVASQSDNLAGIAVYVSPPAPTPGDDAGRSAAAWLAGDAATTGDPGRILSRPQSGFPPAPFAREAAAFQRRLGYPGGTCACFEARRDFPTPGSVYPGAPGYSQMPAPSHAGLSSSAGLPLRPAILRAGLPAAARATLPPQGYPPPQGYARPGYILRPGVAGGAARLWCTASLLSHQRWFHLPELLGGFFDSLMEEKSSPLDELGLLRTGRYAARARLAGTAGGTTVGGALVSGPPLGFGSSPTGGQFAVPQMPAPPMPEVHAPDSHLPESGPRAATMPDLDSFNNRPTLRRPTLFQPAIEQFTCRFAVGAASRRY